MVRQARNYMVGAMSGAGLIAAAVVVFVVLVSALVFEDLPVAGLGGGGDEPSVSAARPAAAGTAVAGATPAPAPGQAAAGAGPQNWPIAPPPSLSPSTEFQNHSVQCVMTFCHLGFFPEIVAERNALWPRPFSAF